MIAGVAWLSLREVHACPMDIDEFAPCKPLHPPCLPSHAFPASCLEPDMIARPSRLILFYTYLQVWVEVAAVAVEEVRYPDVATIKGSF